MSAIVWVITTEISLIRYAIEEETLFDHICSRCHTRFSLVYPLLYHSARNKYAIVLDDGVMPAASLSGVTSILCKSPSQFYLAAHCMEQQLDLKVVLSIRAKLQAKGYTVMRFLEYDALNGMLWFLCDGQEKGIPLNSAQKRSIQLAKIQEIKKL